LAFFCIFLKHILRGADCVDQYMGKQRPCMVLNCLYVVQHVKAVSFPGLGHHVAYIKLAPGSLSHGLPDSSYQKVWDDGREKASRAYDNPVCGADLVYGVV